MNLPPHGDRPPLPPALAAYTDYEVIRELGRGGMGAVYLARNRLTDRLEALKVKTGTGYGERFAREIQAAARLTHPNVVAVHSARLILDTLVLAMEYVDGVDLGRLVTTRGPLPVTLACEVARQAAVGLQFAHDAGIVHRDVKPGNLILAEGDGPVGVVKVLDFGLAKMGDTPNDEWMIGTPAYAAPEQFLHPDRADARADIYALGGTLHFLLTGDPPFRTGPEKELTRRHREDAPPRVDALRPGVPVAVVELIVRMLAKDPADRPQTAAEVARALEPWASGGTPAQKWLHAARTEVETKQLWPGSGSSAGARALTPPTPSASNARVRRRPGFRAPRRWQWAWTGLAVTITVAAVSWRPARPVALHQDSLPAAGTPAPPPVVLFDGLSLDGWVVDGGDAGEWRVEQGAIVATGVPQGPRTWLLTSQEYGNFRIKFEYRLEPGGNSGFVFRAIPGERPVLAPGRGPTPAPYHQQIELSDDSSPRWANFKTGQVNGAATATGPALKPRVPARLRPAGEWNTMEVELLGQNIRVVVNGEEVLARSLDRLREMGSLYPALGRSRGRVGFQQQAKTAEFRNVTIEEVFPPDLR